MMRGGHLDVCGSVVLLERRIVDTAVRAVRNASDEARRAARDDLDAQIRDLEERIRTSWGSGSVHAEGEGRRAPDDGRVLPPHRRRRGRVLPAASSTPRVATPSGTDRSLEREGVSSPDEQTLRDRQARRWPRAIST
jgi:hypothetical protein